MKIFIGPAFFAVLSCFMGCGSSAPSGSNTVAANDNGAANSALVSLPAMPANSSNANVAVPMPVNANVPMNTVAAQKPKMMTFPEPDDSEYYTTMDKNGSAIETRAFHNNPQLIKVVRTWKGVDQKTIEIYLKSGKVVKLSGDKITNINTAPASVFLDAAGIKQPSQPAARPDKTSSPKQPN